jgi:hypothetical protein
VHVERMGCGKGTAYQKSATIIRPDRWDGGSSYKAAGVGSILTSGTSRASLDGYGSWPGCKPGTLTGRLGSIPR